MGGRPGPIDRVKCVVNAGEYSDKRSHCIASGTETEPPTAGDGQQADFASFRPQR
ncbi:MAG TPA: DUF1540 domain-containing protein [Clostridiales bacterium UBA8153]|nr:DUF1540 domain-containing protein [Clostridiales bacterium UBA8153]